MASGLDRLDPLMTEQRRPVVVVLTTLLGIMVLLWFVRGHEIDARNLALFAVSTLLVPITALAVYGFLRLCVGTNQISRDALRWASGLLFAGGTVFLAGSTLFAVRQFTTHRVLPPPNLVAFGVALGAMKAWGLRPAPPSS